MLKKFNLIKFITTNQHLRNKLSAIFAMHSVISGCMTNESSKNVVNSVESISSVQKNSNGGSLKKALFTLGIASLIDKVQSQDNTDNYINRIRNLNKAYKNILCGNATDSECKNLDLAHWQNSFDSFMQNTTTSLNSISHYGNFNDTITNRTNNANNQIDGFKQNVNSITTTSRNSFNNLFQNTKNINYNCKEGYYENDLPNSYRACIKCSSTTLNNMKTCRLNGTNVITTSCMTAGNFPNATGQCMPCSSIIANCTSCFNGGTQVLCSICNNGFITNSDQTSCQSCNDSQINATTCMYKSGAVVPSTCANGYYMNKAGNCVGCSNLYSPAGKCSSCSTTANGRVICTYVSDNTYLPSIGVRSSLFLTSCSSVFPNCNTCNSGSCLSCTIPNTNFLSRDGKTCSSCSTLFPSCNTCSTDVNNKGFCTSCTTKYFVNQINTCSPCVANCDTCTNDYSCTTCSSGYFLDNINKVCCSSSLTNCLECPIAANNCKSCAPNYFRKLDGSACQTCSQAIPNCAACSQPDQTVATTCTTCATGYFVNSNSTCTACITHCNTCTDAATCTNCTTNYFRKIDGTACQNCINTILGCSTCSQPDQTVATTCTTCTSSYYLNSGQCTSCTTLNDFCDICTSNTCNSCQSGYYVNGTSSSCYSCSDGGCFKARCWIGGTGNLFCTD